MSYRDDYWVSTTSASDGWVTSGTATWSGGGTWTGQALDEMMRVIASSIVDHFVDVVLPAVVVPPWLAQRLEWRPPRRSVVPVVCVALGRVRLPHRRARGCRMDAGRWKRRRFVQALHGGRS